MGEGSKVRFDGLDVTAMVAFLQSILGRRVINVYNGDTGETYLFKLDGEKEFLLLESGVRFHTIPSFESSGMPSPFCSKLRKHLRGLRLELVRQIGTDRVVLFQFGAGTSKHCIILELYSKGNLILTDGDYNILALLRSHEYQDSVKVQVGQVYPVTYASTSTASAENETDAKSFVELAVPDIQGLVQEQIAASAKKPKKKKVVVTFKTFLLQPSLKVFQYGPALIEHCILHSKLDPNVPLEGMGIAEDDWHRLQASLKDEGPRHMEKLRNDQALPGFVLYSDNSLIESSGDVGVGEQLAHSDKLLVSFLPHLLLQHQNTPHIKYETFGGAVADFFLHLDVQRRLQKIQSSESAVRSKLAKVQQDQADRLEQLERDQETLMNEAEAVKANAVIVDQALLVINSALDSGMDWDQLNELLEMEQSNQNPVAMIIEKLLLDDDSMVVGLRIDPYDEDSEVHSITVSLKESAHANASRLFSKYRASKDKSQKTVEASSKALKAAEESAQRQLAQSQNKTKQVFQKRKPAWYEKFLWFVTSDNYLVLGGRDSHQNETLVKRYLRPGDAYLHADVHGAASCVLRAKRRRRPDGSTHTLPLSDQALAEAGNFTICRSSAWASRMVTSAWWVESHQVSKTAPSGEYLSVGSFMVRGKKNFLPPSPLEMGLAVLFRLGDDDSIARHQKERRDFSLMQLDDDVGELERPTTKPELPQNIQQEVVSDDDGDDDDEQAIGSANEQSSSELEQESSNNIAEIQMDDPPEEPSSSVADEEPVRKERKGLSVRERKLVKKYGSLEAANSALASRSPQPSKKKPKDDNTAAKIPGKSKRGKRGKAKKIRKYADQDDEDRELAMLALQGGEKHKKKSKESKDEPITEAQSKVAEATAAVLVKDTSQVVANLPESVTVLLAEIVTVHSPGDSAEGEVRWDKFDAETIEQLGLLASEDAQVAAAQRLLNLKKSTRVDNFSASLSGIIRTIQKYGHENINKEVHEEESSKRKTKSQKNAESKEWQQVLKDEGVGDELDEDAVDDTTELSKLTGKPQLEDLLLYAVPVCAPYQTLSQYMYKVKLTPGNMKRGKAAKQCIDMFLRSDGKKTTPAITRNRDLIKKLGDNDWVQVICADVKISSAGASKINKKQKANSKKSKKSK